MTAEPRRRAPWVLALVWTAVILVFIGIAVLVALVIVDKFFTEHTVTCTAIEQGTKRPCSTPTVATPTAQVRHTGIAEVDAIVDAVESGDLDRLVALMRFTNVPCTSTPLPVEHIRCPTGKPEASPEEAFLTISCEGTSMVATDRAVPDLRSRIGTADRSVYAVYHASEPGGGAGKFPAVTYAVVLTYNVQGRSAGLALLVGKNGFIGVDDDCGFPPQQMAELEHWGEAVLPPP